MEIVPSADLRGLHDSSAEREGLEGYDYGQLAQHAQEQFLGEQDFQEPIRVQLILCPLRNGGKGTDIMPRRRESPAP